MEEAVLSIQHLSKYYGKIRAVDDLSLDVHKGNVYGFLGPNGSGKTTTLGIILSVINRSGGDFSWFGKTPSKETRKHIGAILEVPIFYPYLSGEKNLKIVADIKSCSYDGIADVLKTVDLAERKKSKFKTYSLGMKQRLAIAAALIGDPEVLIFDEPTNGLDPQGIAEIRELILRIAAHGKTIILASHLLDEVQKTCTHVVILDKGKDRFAGKVTELTAAPMHVEVGAENMEDLEKHLNANENVIGIDKENMILVVKLKEGYKGAALNEFLISKGVTPTHLSARKKSLEKYFLELLAEK